MVATPPLTSCARNYLTVWTLAVPRRDECTDLPPYKDSPVLSFWVGLHISGCAFIHCFCRGFQREYHRANPGENVSFLKVICNWAQTEQIACSLLVDVYYMWHTRRASCACCKRKFTAELTSQPKTRGVVYTFKTSISNDPTIILLFLLFHQSGIGLIEVLQVLYRELFSGLPAL